MSAQCRSMQGSLRPRRCHPGNPIISLRRWISMSHVRANYIESSTCKTCSTRSAIQARAKTGTISTLEASHVMVSCSGDIGDCVCRHGACVRRTTCRRRCSSKRRRNCRRSAGRRSRRTMNTASRPLRCSSSWCRKSAPIFNGSKSSGRRRARSMQLRWFRQLPQPIPRLFSTSSSVLIS
jgi:hypothetical protein